MKLVSGAWESTLAKWNQMLLPEWSPMANRNRIQTGRGRSFISTFPCRRSLQKWTDKAQMWLLRPSGSSIQVERGRAECRLEAVTASQGCWSPCWVPALLGFSYSIKGHSTVSKLRCSYISWAPSTWSSEGQLPWPLAYRWVRSLWVKTPKNESR